MGVPTSEVGYTSAMPRGEDHEVHKDMWGIGIYIYIYIYITDTTRRAATNALPFDIWKMIKKQTT